MAMQVFDVVQIVNQGAMTSTPAGRWHAIHFGDAGRAEAYARLCQRCASVPGISYLVEAHHEECPGRAGEARDRKAQADCTCG